MISILDEMPVILTQDHNWIENAKFPIKAGMILVLPEDAVLVSLPKEK